MSEYEIVDLAARPVFCLTQERTAASEDVAAAMGEGSVRLAR